MKNLLLIFSVLLSSSLFGQIGPDGTGTVNGHYIGPYPKYSDDLISSSPHTYNLNGVDLSGTDLRPQELSQYYVAIISGYELNQLGNYSDALLIPNGIKEKQPFIVTNEQGEQEQIFKDKYFYETPLETQSFVENLFNERESAIEDRNNSLNTNLLALEERKNTLNDQIENNKQTVNSQLSGWNGYASFSGLEVAIDPNDLLVYNTARSDLAGISVEDYLDQLNDEGHSSYITLNAIYEGFAGSIESIEGNQTEITEIDAEISQINLDLVQSSEDLNLLNQEKAQMHQFYIDIAALDSFVDLPNYHFNYTIGDGNSERTSPQYLLSTPYGYGFYTSPNATELKTKINTLGARYTSEQAGVNLIETSLVDADLSNANLTGAKLQFADLINADLSGAELRYADLTGANLIGANLTGADLTGADLTDADLTDADLTDAEGLENAYYRITLGEYISQSDYNLIIAERDAAIAAQAFAEAERDAKLSLDEVKDLRAGSIMVEIHNGQATLTMEVEESDDLGIWTTGGASTLQIPIDAEADKKFFRFKMADLNNDAYTNSQYQIVEGSFTWEEARLDAISRNGRLAILDTEYKQNLIENMIKNQPNLNSETKHNFAIGLSKHQTEGYWRWIDGSQLNYSKWGPGEPNNQGGGQNYAVLTTKWEGSWDFGQWDDVALINYMNNSNLYLSGYVLEMHIP